jgi:hypothetical protein
MENKSGSEVHGTCKTWDNVPKMKIIFAKKLEKCIAYSNYVYE